MVAGHSYSLPGPEPIHFVAVPERELLRFEGSDIGVLLWIDETEEDPLA